ncbi:N-acetylglutamate synthase [hydrothermal vent metagenome]|uniref:N-acetylglutamate synthase n=1 Tax=hydrothermal vent metagenome TaxID=652676 RepID=A0A3B0VTN9_9ZZZZ
MNIRPATSKDIPAMLALINEHVRRGDVLPRTAQSIRDTLPDWLVGIDADAELIACVSLLYYSEVLAEVRSLAVVDKVKGQGWGSSLVKAIIAQAKQKQVPTLFALTRAVPFFQKVGFTISSRELFPEKVWRDCHVCPLLNNCDETAVSLHLTPKPQPTNYPITNHSNP